MNQLMQLFGRWSHRQSPKYSFRYLFLSMLMLVVLFVGCREKTDVIQPQNDDTNYTQAQLDSMTLASLIKIDNYPMYQMTYHGDYTVIDDSSNDSRKKLSIQSNGLHSDSSWGCTCFAAMGNTSPLYFGRNFDWNYCIPLILFTNPPGRYASVSIVDLEYFGYNGNNLPDNLDRRNNLLRTFQLPFDGMNEKGVAVGMIAVSSAVPPYDPEKKTVGELQIIRLILDNAKNLNEALIIMQMYNIQMDGPPIHYLIADSSRNSAVIEFIEGRMVVIRNAEPWQVSTNFIITGSGAPLGVSCWRYNAAYTHLKITDGSMTNVSAMQLLQQVSQGSTIWSVVYKMTARSLDVAVGRGFDSVKSFSIPSSVGF